MSNLGSKTTDFAIQHPRLITKAMLVITLILVAGGVLPSLLPQHFGFLPAATIDTDPENMLPSDAPARVFHGKSRKLFGLHDAIVVGVVNEKHEAGVFNPSTLEKVYKLSDFAKNIEGVISSDLMSLSTTDSIEHVGPGTVSFDWLMAAPPTTQAEALSIRERAMRIPFLKDTLVSADGKALVIYVPIKDKHIAQEVSDQLSQEINRLGRGDDQFHIAGLPVAEDTFGIEMFKQMAISAPLAMLVIFLLMWFFFRNFAVILAPMYVAMAAALVTMALLVISGNTVHIMSSMIPIFIMPIAVLDAVHIISDFFDTYPSIKDKKKTIQHVMKHLSGPMLFTSLTTTVGFASLALTPIPPVQVFGIFVAIGVLLAWLFTILFVPAYLMKLSPKTLEGFGRKQKQSHPNHDSPGGGLLTRLGKMRRKHSIGILLVAFALIAVSVIGIQKIRVNDNPTKWFQKDHPIRVADRVLNSHFGGTYDAYLRLRYKKTEYSLEQFHRSLAQSAKTESEVLTTVFSEFTTKISAQEGQLAIDALEALDTIARQNRLQDKSEARRIGWSLIQDFLSDRFDIEDSKEAAVEGKDNLISVSGLEAAVKTRSQETTLAYTRLSELSSKIKIGETASSFLDHLRASLEGEKNQPLMAGYLDRYEQRDQIFKQPEMLRYLERFQKVMNTHEFVGKTNSISDIVKVVHRDLISGDKKDYRIPDNQRIVAEILTQYQGSHRKDDLWHFVTTDFENAVVWFQLKSGDNLDMQQVLAFATQYLEENDFPFVLEESKWFGLTYINVVWQESMVTGMVNALLGSFVIVLLMMIFLFRSITWGILSMIPLTLTVALIYGLLGLAGKDYDMPVAVLSSLSLGLAVDYAIHFLARSRELQKEYGDWHIAQVRVFEEPARAISRNVIVVGLGFFPLLFASLVPYQTVGLLIASILFAAGLVTLVLLPALMDLFQPLIFPSKSDNQS